MSAGGPRGGESSPIGDEKTIGEFLSGSEPVVFKLTYDTNPIIIRINLSHSLHQPKPSGSGAGHHKGFFETSGYSSVAPNSSSFIEDVIEVQTHSTCSVYCLK
jgi:hypothetical protein